MMQTEAIEVEQQAVMRGGQWWEFDNKRRREAHNPGDTPRVHLIFDVRVESDSQGQG